MAAINESPPDILTVLIVGCGQIAGGYDEIEDNVIKTHARAYLAHGGFRLVACVDPDPEKARRFARRWNIPHSYTTLAAARGGHYDVVSVCSPPSAHAEQLAALLEWDLRLVFCEKPLTTDSVVSRTLVEMYRLRSRNLAVNYQRRWEPDSRRIAAQIAAGRWGRVLHAHGIYTKGVHANGSHLIDLLQMLLGPLAPRLITEWRTDYSDDDPSVGALLQTAAGSPVVLSLGDCRRFTIFELDIVFSAGRVTFGDSGWTICERRTVDDARYAGYRILEAAQFRATGMSDSLRAAVRNLYDCVTQGLSLASTGETALESQLICQRLQAMANAAPHLRAPE
jgi:predicted dehydrogenase